MGQSKTGLTIALKSAKLSLATYDEKRRLGRVDSFPSGTADLSFCTQPRNTISGQHNIHRARAMWETSTNGSGFFLIDY
jgi:hypothetical protein